MLLTPIRDFQCGTPAAAMSSLKVCPPAPRCCPATQHLLQALSHAKEQVCYLSGFWLRIRERTRCSAMCIYHTTIAVCGQASQACMSIVSCYLPEPRFDCSRFGCWTSRSARLRRKWWPSTNKLRRLQRQQLRPAKRCWRRQVHRRCRRRMCRCCSWTRRWRPQTSRRRMRTQQLWRRRGLRSFTRVQGLRFLPMRVMQPAAGPSGKRQAAGSSRRVRARQWLGRGRAGL